MMTTAQMVGAVMFAAPLLILVGVAFRTIAAEDGPLMAFTVIGGALFAFVWIMVGSYLLVGP